MKPGIYKVYFEVEITACEDEQEATLAVGEMVKDMVELGNFPEVNFELVEEHFPEYAEEEDEVEELNFEENTV